MAAPNEKLENKVGEGKVDFREIKPTTTQEDLKKLRHEVELGKISKNPGDYDQSETNLESADTLDVVLDKVFSRKGNKVPKGSVERIKLTLGSEFDFDTIRKEKGISKWKVDKGELIFTGDKDGSKTTISMPLLPWQALNEKIEVQEEKKHEYALGAYSGAPKADAKVTSIEGSVDATPFGKKLEKPQWYSDKIEAAEGLLSLYGKAPTRFDSATQDLIKSFETKLKEFVTQKGKSPQQIRDDFEKKYSSDEMIGPEGLYNFVLAFQRVLDSYGKDAKKLDESAVMISLKVSKAVRAKTDRYVKTMAGGGTLKDEPGKVTVEGGGVPGSNTGDEAEIYRDKKAPSADHLAVGTGKGSLLPSSEQFKESIETNVASKKLLESYSKNGTKALIEGLKAIPENQRQVVLDSIFQKLGEEDPVKAFQLMKEIIKEEKGSQEAAVYEGLKANMEKAPTENEKNFWQMQMLLFETSQTGDLNEKGEERLSFNASQKKMREIYKLVAKISESNLPSEVQEMFKQQKQYLETSMRQSIAGDLLETASGSVDSMMKNMKDADTYVETSFESLKKMSREEIKDELNQWYGMDNDSEVYMSAKHVLEAVRLAVTYQYPKDVKEGKKIENPVEYYYNEIKNGNLRQIKLDEGVVAPVNDVLLDSPRVDTETLNLETLFVDPAKEFDLYEQMQKGEERLGEDGVWNWLQDRKESIFGNSEWTTTAAALIAAPFTAGMSMSMIGQSAMVKGLSDSRESFLENKGGFVEGTKQMFPPLGEIGKMMDEGLGGKGENEEELGSVERVQIAKIGQLIGMKNYDEARSLCLQILEDRLNAKKKLEKNEIKDKAFELESDYGEKIRAQVKIELQEKNIDTAALIAKHIPRPGGGEYTDLQDYTNDRVKMALDEMAYVRLQSVAADTFTDEEVNQMSSFEKMAYGQMQYLNGHKADTLWLKPEHADVVKDVTKMVVEIIIIEVATLGIGSYFAGAAGAAEGAAMAARAGSVAVRAGEVGTNVTRASRIGHMMFEAGRTGRMASVLGGRLGAPIRYLYEGNTALARGARMYLHGAAFVEAQSFMNGRPVNPFSVKGQVEIATAASTMYALGKLNQFTRGATAGARMAEEGALTSAGKGVMADTTTTGIRAMPGIKNIRAGIADVRSAGWRAMPGIRQLNEVSARLGTFQRALAESAAAGSTGAKIGSALYTGAEITLEIAALKEMGEFQQNAQIMLGDLIEKATGTRSGLLTEDEKKAMHDPDTFNTLAHTAGVVLGLRTWRAASGKLEAPGKSGEVEYTGPERQLPGVKDVPLIGDYTKPKAGGPEGEPAPGKSEPSADKEAPKGSDEKAKDAGPKGPDGGAKEAAPKRPKAPGKVEKVDLPSESKDWLKDWSKEWKSATPEKRDAMAAEAQKVLDTVDRMVNAKTLSKAEATRIAQNIFDFSSEDIANGNLRMKVNKKLAKLHPDLVADKTKSGDAWKKEIIEKGKVFRALSTLADRLIATLESPTQAFSQAA